MDCQDQAAGRSVGFHAAPLATGTLASAAHGRHVAEFSGKTIMAVDQFSIHHKAAADSGAERDHGEVFHVFRTSIDHFTDGGCIGIVGDSDRHVVMLAKQVHKRNDALPGQVGRMLDGASVVVGIRRTDANAHQFQFIIDVLCQLADGFHEGSDVVFDGCVASG